VTVVPVEVDGTWYLLSTYGNSDWVRNVRASGRAQLRHRGKTEAIAAVEVDGDERDGVSAQFHEKTPKMFQKDFDQRPAAADHPAFRVEPIA
jgi:deazaflavin-dependent oxidoreductase (nitroreductase family)